MIWIQPPVIDDDEEARKAAIEKHLAKFRERKNVLLTSLRSAHDRGSKAKPFDNDKLWSQIEILAYIHYSRLRIMHATVSAGDRRAQYREIADTLRRAHTMLEEALQSSDLANDLIGSWWHGTAEYAEADGHFVDLLYIENKFKKMIKKLTVLESAATRAADEVQRGRGRPRGTSVLSPQYIYALANLYRDHTGLKPGAGKGPFVRFTMAYLTAIGHANIGSVAEATVIDAIKDLRARTRRNPGKWAPSPFED